LGKIGPLGDKKKGGSIGQRSKLQTIENSLKIVHKSSGVGLAGVGMGLGFKPTPPLPKVFTNLKRHSKWLKFIKKENFL